MSLSAVARLAVLESSGKNAVVAAVDRRRSGCRQTTSRSAARGRPRVSVGPAGATQQRAIFVRNLGVAADFVEATEVFEALVAEVAVVTEARPQDRPGRRQESFRFGQGRALDLVGPGDGVENRTAAVVRLSELTASEP